MKLLEQERKKNMILQETIEMLAGHIGHALPSTRGQMDAIVNTMRTCINDLDNQYNLALITGKGDGTKIKNMILQDRLRDPNISISVQDTNPPKEDQLDRVKLFALLDRYLNNHSKVAHHNTKWSPLLSRLGKFENYDPETAKSGFYTFKSRFGNVDPELILVIKTTFPVPKVHVVNLKERSFFVDVKAEVEGEWAHFRNDCAGSASEFEDQFMELLRLCKATESLGVEQAKFVYDIDSLLALGFPKNIPWTISGLPNGVEYGAFTKNSAFGDVIVYKQNLDNYRFSYSFDIEQPILQRMRVITDNAVLLEWENVPKEVQVHFFANLIKHVGDVRIGDLLKNELKEEEYKLTNSARMEKIIDLTNWIESRKKLV